jgi:hypothetical protein
MVQQHIPSQNTSGLKVDGENRAASDPDTDRHPSAVTFTDIKIKKLRCAEIDLYALSRTKERREFPSARWLQSRSLFLVPNQ